jgi:hypothetical protein
MSIYQIRKIQPEDRETALAVLNTRTRWQGRNVEASELDPWRGYVHNLTEPTFNLKAHTLACAWQEDGQLAAFQHSSRFGSEYFAVTFTFTNAKLDLPKTYGSRWSDVVIDLLNWNIDLYEPEGRNLLIIPGPDPKTNPDWDRMVMAAGSKCREWPQTVISSYKKGEPLREEDIWLVDAYADPSPDRDMVITQFERPDPKFFPVEDPRNPNYEIIKALREGGR